MSARRVVASCCAVLLSSSGLALPRPCAAQPTQAATPAPADVDTSRTSEAAAHFRRGVMLYKEADTAGAIVEFRRAYELAPNYRVLYNIGQTYYQLQRYADALKALREYLSAGGTGIPAKRRAAVEHDIRQLEAHVAQVEVHVNADGASVLVDDEPVGVSPLGEPVLVSVGRRRISASREGAAPVERVVEVGPGDHARVDLDLPAAAPSPPAHAAAVARGPNRGSPGELSLPLEPERAAQSPVGGRSVAMWALWAGAGAFAAATAVTGVLALAAKSDLSTQLNTFPGNPDQIDQARSRAKGFGVASDVLLGVTAITTGVALYVTLTRPPAVGAGRGVQVGFGAAGVGAAGVQLRGQY